MLILVSIISLMISRVVFFPVFSSHIHSVLYNQLFPSKHLCFQSYLSHNHGNITHNSLIKLRVTFSQGVWDSLIQPIVQEILVTNTVYACPCAHTILFASAENKAIKTNSLDTYNTYLQSCITSWFFQISKQHLKALFKPTTFQYFTDLMIRLLHFLGYTLVVCVDVKVRKKHHMIRACLKFQIPLISTG